MKYTLNRDIFTTTAELQRLLAVTLALLGSLAAVEAQTLLWSEEFNYNSTINSNIWTAELGDGSQYGIFGWGNNELQIYTEAAENVRVDGSNLVITAIANEASQGRPGSRDFTSARIKTQNKLTLRYGTVEARIQTPDVADGLWPAFWTMGDQWQQGQSWPNCGEIDIMEMGSVSAITDGVVNRRVGSHAHWDNAGSYAGYGLAYDNPSDIDGNWVVYRMEWTPFMIRTYIDGVLIWEIDIRPSVAPELEEFHQPHFLLLNLAVGGNYTGINSDLDITAPFPAEYRVDWIRIYDNGYTQLGGSSTINPLPFALQSSIAGGNIEISFPTQNGFDYEVMSKSSLTNESWIPIETVVGDGSTNTVTYPATNPAMFYQVVAP